MAKNINPDVCIYTACFCEENIWQLLSSIQQQFPEDFPNSYAVFISNEKKVIPIYCQKAGNNEEGSVCWDYHVIMILKTQEGSHVFDFDSTLTFPVDFRSYIDRAIMPNELFPVQYHRLFRVVTGESLLRHMASDRSHMLKGDGVNWLKPPPHYPCLVTNESTNNLPSYIEMNCSLVDTALSDLSNGAFSGNLGQVVTLKQLCNFFA